MSKKIAYFTNVYPAVSHAFIRREIRAVEREGFEVARFALRGWDSEIYDPQDAEERERTRYVLRGGPVQLALAALRVAVSSPGRFLAGVRLAWRQGRRSIRAMPYHFVYLAEACQLLRWLCEQGVTHVHAHFGTNSAEVVMLAHALGGPSYSFTVHGPVEFDNIDYFGLADKIGRSAFTVAITDFTRSQLCRAARYSDWARIEVVRCGLDPEFFAAAPKPVPDVARLTCIGRLVEQKGQLVLVQAAARLRERGVRFELSILGGGPMEAEVREQVRRLGLEGCVEMPGAVSTERLLGELKACRGLVLPSFAEGLPMVIMEAMAMGRPVISTYVAGIPELVVPGENGWLVPASSVEALADAMEALLATPVAQLSAMGAAGFERTRRLHNADTLGSTLARLFAASIEEQTG